jgi:hypothetical protein
MINNAGNKIHIELFDKNPLDSIPDLTNHEITPEDRYLSVLRRPGRLHEPVLYSIFLIAMPRRL